MSTSSLFSRRAGILLHPTSLPGGHGVGDLGVEAHQFVDWLASAGLSVWQILPLGPTGAGNSPYAGWSVHAGNPLLIDLRELSRAGLLEEVELGGAPENRDRVDFAQVTAWKLTLLDRAAGRFLEAEAHPWRLEHADFVARSTWLEDVALFDALHRTQQGRPWWTWPAPLRDREEGALREALGELQESVGRFGVVQFFFDRQWRSLREHARARGLQLFGDLPIYTAHDSADVWADRALFQLDALGRPLAVAGVPPDAFSATGQLWGNPLYHWPRHAEQGYRWWISRMRRVFELVDIVRIDHFRAFSAYWRVSAQAEDARDGRWAPGPGGALFEALREALGPLPIVAEDLGIIDEGVVELLRETGFPGMRVLQFAFGGGAEDVHLPHNHSPQSVIYTGTHDNDTILGWWQASEDKVRHHLRTYLGVDGHDVVWDLIRAALASVGEMAIVTAQDLLALDASGRMNTPSVAEGNWSWRLLDGQLTGAHAVRIRDLCRLYARLPEGGSE